MCSRTGSRGATLTREASTATRRRTRATSGRRPRSARFKRFLTQSCATAMCRRSCIAASPGSTVQFVGFAVMFFTLLTFGPAPLAAENGVRLDGPRTQGGLLRGRVPPGSTVEYEGDAVRVSADGWFLVGFGRDARAEAELVVVFPDGRRERQVLGVEPREYDIQRIDGLPPRKVTPRSEEDLARIRGGRRDGQEGPDHRPSPNRLPRRLPVADQGPDQRRLRLAAHPQRRASQTALRNRHRGADRNEGRGAGGRRGHHGASGHVLLPAAR